MSQECTFISFSSVFAFSNSSKFLRINFVNIPKKKKKNRSFIDWMIDSKDQSVAPNWIVFIFLLHFDNRIHFSQRLKSISKTNKEAIKFGRRWQSSKKKRRKHRTQEKPKIKIEIDLVERSTCFPLKIGCGILCFCLIVCTGAQRSAKYFLSKQSEWIYNKMIGRNKENAWISLGSIIRIGICGQWTTTATKKKK